mmetsp:Transcript_11984/g.28087  ORF Transcript_11984/g.28087 Transcript_11984/m.28087 type:complete len:85 (+) Transcript_11984:459-713(+)
MPGRAWEATVAQRSMCTVKPRVHPCPRPLPTCWPPVRASTIDSAQCIGCCKPSTKGNGQGEEEQQQAVLGADVPSQCVVPLLLA